MHNDIFLISHEYSYCGKRLKLLSFLSKRINGIESGARLSSVGLKGFYIRKESYNFIFSTFFDKRKTL
jgi:hypothetical protein